MSAPHHVLILTADQNRGEKQQRVLEKHGYRVKQANDLQDALARIQEREPDVVVTDLWVGDSPTALVVKTIQKVAPKAQFIAIQLDVTQTQYARDAMHAGAFCTLPATCENHLLLATVLRAVETRLLRSDLAEVQERLALFFRSVDTGILLVDADSRQIVDVNPAAETLCRRSKEALVGRVSDAPDSGLPHLRTLTTLHLGGKAYWLQGIDDDLGASRYDELLAKLSVLQSVVFEDVSDVCLTVMANGRIENVIHGGVLAGVRMQVGRDAADLFRGDARAEFEYACKRVFETGEPQYLSRIGSDGPEMSVRILPVMSRDVVGSALVHTRHIDANVREERRLRLRDKATDDAGIGLLIVSSEGLIIDANQHLLDRLGFTRRVLMEKCYWMIDRECREEHWGDLWAGLDVDLKQMGDRIYRDVREGPAAMRVSMRRVVDGSDTFAVFLSQDAAELLAVQDAVEDLRAHDQVVLDLIQDSVIALDRRGYIREANKAACEWLHRDPARVVGKCYYDV
ncbi:MAG: PAS domain-containing protein, partial [Verrucomicrobia bacterium]|nr:PAS domain-containing protein [Verrucomicrobiota bacterium]